jgi:hypothetical protein
MVVLPVMAQSVLLQRRGGLKLKAGCHVEAQRLCSSG